MRVVGIDPGLTGALALLADDGRLADVRDIPVAGGWINGHLLKQIVTTWHPDHVYVELIHAMPKNGSKAAFSQGDSWGAIRTAVQCAGVPLTTVSPISWKARFGLNLRGLKDAERKERSRRRALDLFPGSDYFDRKKDHNRAEAAMIGLYGWRELA